MGERKMREAFTYMFQDNKFWQKACVYMGILFLANLLSNYAKMLSFNCTSCTVSLPPAYYITFIAGYIINLIPLGYAYSCIKSLFEQNENYVLPTMDLKKNFITGLKFLLSIGLIFIPIILVTVLIYGIAYYNPIITVTALKFLDLVICILFLIYFIPFMSLFAKEESIFTLFKFRTATKAILNNKRNYFIALFISILFFIANYALGVLLAYIFHTYPVAQIAEMLISVVISTVVWTYIIFVINFLVAKAIK